MRSLDDQMELRFAHDEFPGAVWLVAQGGDVTVDTVGVTAVGGKRPMRRDFEYRGSGVWVVVRRLPRRHKRAASH